MRREHVDSSSLDTSSHSLRTHQRVNVPLNPCVRCHDCSCDATREWRRACAVWAAALQPWTSQRQAGAAYRRAFSKRRPAERSNEVAEALLVRWRVLSRVHPSVAKRMAASARSVSATRPATSGTSVTDGMPATGQHTRRYESSADERRCSWNSLERLVHQPSGPAAALQPGWRVSVQSSGPAVPASGNRRHDAGAKLQRVALSASAVQVRCCVT